MWLILFFLINNLLFCLAGDISSNVEWRLMKELLRRYENRQSLRAVTSPSEAVNVTLSMKLVQIIELVRYIDC